MSWLRTGPPGQPAPWFQSWPLSEVGGAPKWGWVLGGCLWASADRAEGNVVQDLRPPASPGPDTPRAVELEGVLGAADGLEDGAQVIRAPQVPSQAPPLPTEFKAVNRTPPQRLPSSTPVTLGGQTPSPAQHCASGPAEPAPTLSGRARSPSDHRPGCIPWWPLPIHLALRRVTNLLQSQSSVSPSRALPSTLVLLHPQGGRGL